ncbi:unnamed protein product [Didymodactylos carnosus]|uniref:Uncharacterized protein n=1 Tax=Didymodactylos carnosus TaxID=1234261 RepID=A0A815U4E0_9BILA|nr:unnamed protein product [Didymodactylos carnosus]CAF4374689.1 unnamed protein product [Didymodactylos carnosus]
MNGNNVIKHSSDQFDDGYSASINANSRITLANISVRNEHVRLTSPPQQQIVNSWTLGSTTVNKKMEDGRQTDIEYEPTSLQLVAKELVTDEKIRKIARNILTHKSVLMSKTDIINISTHSPMNRDQAKQRLLNDNLIKRNMFFSSRNKTNNTLVQHEGFMKSFPADSSLTEQLAFMKKLSQFNLTWQQYLNSFTNGQQITIDPITNKPIITIFNVHTTNAWFISEKAESIFRSEPYYGDYVNYNEHQVLRPIQQVATSL